MAISSSDLRPFAAFVIVPIFSQTGIAVCCACFELLLAAPAAPSAQRHSRAGSLLKGSLNLCGAHQEHLKLQGSDLSALCGPTLPKPPPLPTAGKVTPVGLCRRRLWGRAADVGVGDSQGTGNQNCNEPCRNQLQPRQLEQLEQLEQLGHRRDSG